MRLLIFLWFMQTGTLPPVADQKVPTIDLAYKWKITWLSFTSFAREAEHFPAEEKEAYQKKLKKAFIRFRQNKAYSMRVFNTKDQGTWTAKGNELTLNSDEGGKVKFKIEKISAKALKLYNVQKNDTLFMLIKR